EQNALEVDFLMFLSTPKNVAKLTEIVLKDPKGDLTGPPTVQGVELSQVWKDRFAVIGGRGQGEGGAPAIHGLDPESQREWTDLAQQYAADKIKEDDVFTRWQPGLERLNFVGLANFAAMLEDEYLRTGFVNVAIIVATTVLKDLTVPLLVAELIFHLRWPRLQYWLRTLFVVPMVMPG